MNIVVFQLNSSDDDLITAAAPAQDPNGVQEAWRQARQQQQIPPSEVTRVHSTWQPSNEDQEFLDERFPDAQHTHIFERPESDDWTDAFEHAHRVMAEAERIELHERAEEMTAHASGDGEWLPILHSTNAPLPFSASLPLVEGKLYVGFAKVAITPAGRIGMSHLTKSSFGELSEEEFVGLVDEATGNLTSSLTFNVYQDEELGAMATIERDGPCAGSAILLDDFHAQAARILGADQLIVGLVSPDHIFIADAESGHAEVIREAVLTSPDTGSELVPCLLRVDADAIDVIAERPR